MRRTLARTALWAGLLILPGCSLLELPFQLLGAVGGALVDGVGSLVGMLGQIVPAATRSAPFLVLSTEADPRVDPGTPVEEFVPSWAREPDALASVLESPARSYAEAIEAAPAATHHFVLRLEDFRDPLERARWERTLRGHRLLELTPIDSAPTAVALAD